MGILDRFTKNNQKKQLEAFEKKADVQIPEKKDASAKKSVEKNTAVVSKKTKENKGKAGAFVLVRPIVSEKAAQGEARGKYTFVVDSAASKISIKQAVREIYGVAPEKVRVSNVEGKRVRFGRQKGKRKDWKKATVTLPKGKTIQIHEGV
jgi:large subunit ribosomal protein L23